MCLVWFRRVRGGGGGISCGSVIVALVFFGTLVLICTCAGTSGGTISTCSTTTTSSSHIAGTPAQLWIGVDKGAQTVVLKFGSQQGSRLGDFPLG